MADNQMVKIVFDFDLGNVPASAKKLSQYLKDNSLDLKFTKASVDGLSASLGQLSTEQTKAGKAGAAAGASIKKSNMQWTNFALVIQDLPYGFRGIQNNLPALMGGIAGMAGPIYFVGSAIIALFTAWDAGLFKVKDGTNALNDAQKEYNETLKSSMGTAGEEIAKMNALVSIAGNHEIAMEKRLSAVKKLQEEYPSYFGNLDKEKILNGDVATAVDTVKIAIIERAKATAIASKINAVSAAKFVQEEKLYQLALQKTARVQAAVNFVKQFPSSAKNLQGLIDASVGGIRKQENEIKSFVNIIDKELNRLSGLYTESKKISIGLDDGKIGKTSAGTLDDPNIALLQAKQKYYKDDLLMFASYQQEILAAQRNLAVRQAELEGKSGKYIQTIKDTYNQLILNSQAETGRKIIEEQRKLGLEEAKEYEKLAKEKARLDKEAYDLLVANKNRELQNTLDAIKIESQARQKLHKGDSSSIKQDLINEKDALLELAAAGFYTAQQFDKIVDAMVRVDAQIKGIGSAWEQTSVKIVGLIEGVMSDSISQFAENIGKSFNGEDVDIFGGITEIIATGLQNIGKALIAYGTAMDAFKLAFTNPFAAIAAGIVLVATGAALQGSIKNMNNSASKTKKFANGGIISGPTMGLMGEYPGARTNPEVVAPLDKLKDMIGGGGGGTFMLRGQDLLLSVNRAQKASNLKGQNISLA